MDYLALGLLSLLKGIHWVVPSWGLSIILLAAIVRILLSPLSKKISKEQKKFVELQTQIQPEIARIKATYKGGEQSERILRLYEKNGVSPFSGLKPMVIFLIQLPIFMALYRAFTMVAEMKGNSFLWIEDLSLPDRLFEFPFELPVFGSDFNLLPILMTITTIACVKLVPAPAVDPAQGRVQNFFLVGMALGFLLLFYPFPSGMVLYWTMANVLQVVPLLKDRVKRV